MARPGTSLVSSHTHKLTRDFFESQALGKMEVKGKEGPEEVFELIKTGEVDTRITASVAKGLTRFVGLGLAHCPEGKRIFYSMKVIDNLILGAFLRKDNRGIASDLEVVYTCFPVLKARNKQLAGRLSGAVHFSSF